MYSIALLFAAKLFIICSYLCRFNLFWCCYVLGGTYMQFCSTPLWSVGTCITSSQFVWAVCKVLSYFIGLCASLILFQPCSVY